MVDEGEDEDEDEGDEDACWFLYYPKQWTVGHALDDIRTRLQVRSSAQMTDASTAVTDTVVTDTVVTDMVVAESAAVVEAVCERSGVRLEVGSDHQTQP